MSAQNLNPRSIRRIARATGLEVAHGWGHGDPAWLAFVTTDHRHGAWNRRTNEVEWSDNPTHYQSCSVRFPEQGATPGSGKKT